MDRPSLFYSVKKLRFSDTLEPSKTLHSKPDKTLHSKSIYSAAHVVKCCYWQHSLPQDNHKVRTW